MWPSSSEENATMNPVNDAPADALGVLVGGTIDFPTGLLGFANCRRFTFNRFDAGDGQVSPFYVLNCLDQELSFLVIQPELVVADYRVSCFPELLKSFGADSAAEVLAMVIVTVRERLEDITVNLQGPLVVATRSQVGIQLILEEFPLRHPLLASPNR